MTYRLGRLSNVCYIALAPASTRPIFGDSGGRPQKPAHALLSTADSGLVLLSDGVEVNLK